MYIPMSEELWREVKRASAVITHAEQRRRGQIALFRVLCRAWRGLRHRTKVKQRVLLYIRTNLFFYFFFITASCHYYLVGSFFLSQ